MTGIPATLAPRVGDQIEVIGERATLALVKGQTGRIINIPADHGFDVEFDLGDGKRRVVSLEREDFKVLQAERPRRAAPVAPPPDSPPHPGADAGGQAQAPDADPNAQAPGGQQ